VGIAQMMLIINTFAKCHKVHSALNYTSVCSVLELDAIFTRLQLINNGDIILEENPMRAIVV
jgi:hypothetical protein